MVDIIIPAYNAHRTIEQTLCSIAYQDMSELVNVYIINDNSDSDYKKYVDFFSHFINIKELKLDKNSGPGVARQYGIDNSNGKYIIFIDSDDCFTDCFCLKKLYTEIENNNADVAIGTIIEELDSDFHFYYNSHIWLHGKIYKRNYLKKNKIYFNESRYNEDTGFNQLFFMSNPKIVYIEDKIYLWRNNKESITRRNDNSFFDKLTPAYIYNINWALETAIERNYDKQKIAESASIALMYIYYIYIQVFDVEFKKNLIKQMKFIKKIFDEYSLEEEEKNELLKIQYDSMINNNNYKYFLNPEITFNQYLQMIDEAGEFVD